MPDDGSSGQDQVRTAELIASLCLATDLGMGLPLEHGLQSTVCAMRLADLLGVDADAATQTYYGCLLYYVGCTADAALAAIWFEDGALMREFNPVMWGSRPEILVGILRALAGREGATGSRVVRAARTLPGALRGHREHTVALCEVAKMLSARLAVDPAVPRLFAHLTERWDGHGEPGTIKGDRLPLALRIMHVARDATFHAMLGGHGRAADVIRARSGHAFDPAVSAQLVQHVADVVEIDAVSAWDDVLALEPGQPLMSTGDEVDRALATMGEFADLVSPHLIGHSSSVAGLAAAAAEGLGMGPAQVLAIRRAGYVHDLGRVAVSPRVWEKPSALSSADWEQVRLHGYHTERALCRSPFLAGLVPVATAHHERLDGSGYHRGATAPVSRRTRDCSRRPTHTTP